MKRKILAALSAAALTISVAACGEVDEDPGDGITEPTIDVPETTPDLGDGTTDDTGLTDDTGVTDDTGLGDDTGTTDDTFDDTTDDTGLGDDTTGTTDTTLGG